jgi:hypothetical protein
MSLLLGSGISSTWKMSGGKMCSHGSVMTEQPVCFVSYSASDFAGSAYTPLARASASRGDTMVPQARAPLRSHG